MECLVCLNQFLFHCHHLHQHNHPSPHQLGVEQVVRFGDFVREIPAKKLVLAGISLSNPEYPFNPYHQHHCRRRCRRRHHHHLHPLILLINIIIIIAIIVYSSQVLQNMVHCSDLSNPTKVTDHLFSYFFSNHTNIFVRPFDFTFQCNIVPVFRSNKQKNLYSVKMCI